MAAVFFFGLAKFVLGIQRDKPVGFLLALLIGVAVLTLGYFFKIPLRTRQGDVLLRRLKDQYAKLKTLGERELAFNTASASTHNDLILAAGLFGFAAIHHPEITFLNSNLKPISTTSQAGTGCGTSVSSDRGGCGGGDGGGCGGGCGGCGGD